MRRLTEAEVNKYLQWTDRNVISLEELKGRCFICGRFLADTDLPDGPEKVCVCKECLPHLIESYEELEEEELI